jgi:hypothetical protein
MLPINIDEYPSSSKQKDLQKGDGCLWYVVVVGIKYCTTYEID